ncbi:toxin-activating lysine-acyltransferase [Photobacterium frigidiphilum]|uniref:RTX toxin-activating lysine-acyltransferase n=1 Tax=Photobacterium frigidiphilum TaxID=264736 RepID=A0A2T3JEL7_9GAMM|nr:toxin-activating lysine-acyltransferase [Photobacterium frigidiphilum]PSU47328.1 toxin-activating lysine-acyltransferase [Photobacterium frigidiphilum]
MLSLNTLNRTISPSTPYCHNNNMVAWSLGNIVEICARDSRYKKVDIQSFLHWVKPAILHGQYKLFYTQDNIRCTGFIFWAWVNNDTVHRYINSNRFFLQPSEWNEGRNLIIVDYCDLTKSSNNIRKLFTIAELINKNVDSISYCVRNEVGIPEKVRKFK